MNKKPRWTRNIDSTRLLKQHHQKPLSNSRSISVTICNLYIFAYSYVLYFRFIALNYNHKNIIQLKFLFPHSFVRMHFISFYFFCTRLATLTSCRKRSNLKCAASVYSTNCDTTIWNRVLVLCKCARVCLPQNQCLRMKNLSSFSAWQSRAFLLFLRVRFLFILFIHFTIPSHSHTYFFLWCSKHIFRSMLLPRRCFDSYSFRIHSFFQL